MKIKYHKIRNVPLEVCTAEQMIAYNLAQSKIDIIKKSYDRCETEIQKSDIVSEGVKLCMRRLANSYEYESKRKKYNIDAIFCALMAGMEQYIQAKYHILASHDEVGKMFPANYL